MKVINNYRLVLTTLKSKETTFKTYYYFDKTDEGMKLMEAAAVENKKLVNSTLYNKCGFAEASFFITFEIYKKTDEMEMTSEISHYQIK